MQPRLTRSRTDRMVAGVCGGLAEYFAIDPVIVRLVFVLVSLTSGIGLIVYPVMWLVMPKAGPEPAFPNDPEEWRRRVQAVGQEAAEFGQSVEREMREAFGGRSQGPGGGAPTTYAPPPSESYNYDPYTGQPIVPARPRRPGPRWIGIALVGLGILFAAQHFGLPTDILFPLLMIGAGGAILLRK
jgi:phage shock protein C